MWEITVFVWESSVDTNELMHTLLFLLSSYIGADPGLVEGGADKCLPKVYYPCDVRGHAPLEKFWDLGPRKGDLFLHCIIVGCHMPFLAILKIHFS